MTQTHSTREFSYFKIISSRTEHRAEGYTRLHVRTKDRFYGPRYALGRAGIRAASEILERYLRMSPHTTYDSKFNIARSFIYLSPAMRALYEYMPGGFVTYHAYNPIKNKTRNGKSLDFLARTFFRHTADGMGIRSRAYMMAWRTHDRYQDATAVRWMSIACGVGQATFDAAGLLPGDVSFFLCDMDDDALSAARDMAKSYHIESDRLETQQLNVIKQHKTLVRYLTSFQPQVIDVMGLFEYLDEAAAVLLLKSLYRHMPEGGSFFFTNMLPSHPHFAVHARGLGWPGVIRRSEQEVLQLLERAGVPVASVTVLLPHDHVYAVYEVVK